MKNIVIGLTLLFVGNSVFGQSKEDNIIINERQETYEYLFKKGEVIVEEKSKTIYLASKMSGETPVSEMYDEKSSIDRVKIKGSRNSIPKYNLYSSNNFFYSDAKICYFELNIDQKGKTAEVEFTKTYNDPRYFTSIYLSEPLFLQKKVVKIIVPDWMKIELNDYNFSDNVHKEIIVDEKKGIRTYQYTIEKEDAMKKESNQQGASHIYPHIMVLHKSSNVEGVETTYFEKLEDLYSWYNNIVAEVQDDKAVMASKAKEITEGSTSDIEKVKKIYAWVQENIRYVAFEDGIAGFKPDNAQEVLRKKYGDCKGMANLVKALLVSQGIDARLTWIGTDHKAYDYSTPSIVVDNHMICTVFLNGQTYYLDPTVEYMPLGEYPRHIQGRQVMISDGNKFILSRIPEFAASANKDSISNRYTIENDKLIGDVKWELRGEAKQVILSLINSTPKDELKNALKSFAESGNFQDVASNLELKGANPQSKSVDIHYTLEYSSGVQVQGNDLYIDLNRHKDFMNSLIDLEERKSNVLLRYKHNPVRNIELVIPKGYKLSHLPDNMSLQTDKYKFNITYEKEGNIIRYKSELSIDNPLILKSEFKQWNSSIAELKKNYMEQIILEKE